MNTTNSHTSTDGSRLPTKPCETANAAPVRLWFWRGRTTAGKSLFQNLLTLILGGRTAKPYQYMMGATSFNADLFEAEHLAMEDEHASTDIRTRRHFGSQLKNVTVNDSQRCHGKHQKRNDPLSLLAIECFAQ
jgi:hypothetical protein